MLLFFAQLGVAQNIALNFDGAGEFIELSNKPVLMQTAFTVEFYMKTNTEGALFRAFEGGVQQPGIYLEVLNTGRVRYFFQSDFTDGTTIRQFNSDVSVNDGQWHHVAATLDNNNVMRLYIDGQLQTVTATANSPLIFDPFVWIGKGNNSNPRPFNGCMDEIRIWSEAKTGNDINASIDCGIQLINSDLLVYYNMEEGIANNNITLVPDLAGGDGVQNATATNPPNYVDATTALSFTECPILHPTDGEDSGQTITVDCSVPGDFIEYLDNGGVNGVYNDTHDPTTVTFCPDDDCKEIMVQFYGMNPFDLEPANVDDGTLGDILSVHNGTTATDDNLIKDSNDPQFRYMMFMPDSNCDDNPNGCLAFKFTPDGDTNKGAGWRMAVSCADKTLNLTCPEMAMVAGQFEDVAGTPSCNVQGRYTIPTPALADDSECITNINYTVTLDLNGSGLEVQDEFGVTIPDGDPVNVGDQITIIADDFNEIEKCIKLSYTATCGTSTVTASCTDQEVCLFAPSITSSNKKVGLNDGCKATITPQTFVGQTCDLLTYTLNVFDSEGNREGEEDASSVFIDSAGIYTVLISDGLSSVMCMITIIDAQAPICVESTLSPKYTFCAGNIPTVASDLEFTTPTFTDCSDIPDTTCVVKMSGNCGDLTIEGETGSITAPPATFFTLVDGVYVGIDIPNTDEDYFGFEILKAFEKTWTVTDEHGNTSLPCKQQYFLLRPVFAEASFERPKDITISSCDTSIDPADLADDEVPHYIGKDEDGNDEIFRLGEDGCKYTVRYEIVLEKVFESRCMVEQIRRYSIYNCCEALDPGTAITFDQIITVEIDELQLTCPTFDEIENGAIIADASCMGSLNLIAPTLTGATCVSLDDVTFDYTLTQPNPLPAITGTGLTAQEIEALADLTLTGIGKYTLSFTANSDCIATGGAGNTCEILFSLIDDTPPTAICQTLPVPVTLGADGNGVLTPAEVDNGSSDNCANPVTLSLDRTAFDCSDLDESNITVTLTVSDGSTSTTCTSQVTIDPAGNCPEANCVQADFQLDGSGNDDDNDGLIEFILDGNGEVTVLPGDLRENTSIGDDFFVSLDGTTPLIPNEKFYNNSSGISTPSGNITQMLYLIAEKNGFTASCKVNLEIEDRTAPTITDCGTLEIDIQNGVTDDFSQTGINVTDNCALSPTVSFDPPSATCSGGIASPSSVILTASDQSGNTSTCNVSISCFNRIASIAGRISGVDDLGLSNVQLHLEGQNSFTIQTDYKGSFTFPEIELGNTYMLKPEKNTLPLNGVSTLDIILLSQHLLGTQEFTTPHQYIAADVTKDGRLSVSDMMEIRQLILDKMDKYSNNNSWRFIDGNFEFPQRVNPLRAQIPESYLISELTEDMEINFVGVKVGDINGDASPNDLPGSGIRSNNSLVLTTDDMILEKGNTYQIPIRATSFDQIQGYQFSLDFDPNAVEIVGWEAGALEGMNDSHFGSSHFGRQVRQMEQGKINTSWVNEQQQILEDGSVLFHISLSANKKVSLKDVLSLNSNGIQAEAYKGESITSIETMNVALEYNSTVTPSDEMVLYQNRPNPFANETEIAFQMPQATVATLSVFDVSGKMILQQSIDAIKGYNKFSLSANDLPEGNLYYYRLESAVGTATKKMVLIK